MDISLNLTTESVDRVMVDSPLVISPEVSVREALGQLNEHKTGGLLVCRDQKLIGVFTERDALQLLAGDNDLDQPIENVMTTSPDTLHPGETVAAAVRSMARGGFRRVPIVDENQQPLGVLKASGIVHYIVEHFPKSVYNLPPAPDTIMQEREGA